MAIPRWLGILLLLVGVLAVIGGVFYVSVPAHSLPSFVPGHIAGSNYHHNKRGIAGIVLGLVLLAVGGFIGFGGGASKA
jgi:hypothetical protein